MDGILRLTATVLSVVQKHASQGAGAKTVEKPVRLEGRFKAKRGQGTVEADALTALTEKLALRLADDELEFARLEPEEGERVLLAVQSTLGAEITMAAFQSAHANPVALRRLLVEASGVPGESEPPGFTEAAAQLYERLLEVCCEHIVEHFTRRPEFATRALLQQSQDLGELLRRVPEPASVDAFGERYIRSIKQQLDRTDALGADLHPEEDSYRLTTAYVNLLLRKAPSGFTAGGLAGMSGVAGPLESVLAQSPRLLLEGPAGSGKTTLIRRLARHIADGTLPAHLEGWNNRIPFVLRLRSLLSEGRLRLPQPEDFVRESGSMVSGEKPDGWVSACLAQKRGVLLVDGLDEVPAEHRDAVVEWVEEICGAYPFASCIVTSRPRVMTRSGRMRMQAAGFATAELQSMSRTQVGEFVERWHRTQAAYGGDAAELEECGRALDAVLDERRDLARLATNPLLCALICALHRNTHRALPEGRSELYRAALTMMLGGREKARRIAADRVHLQPRQKEKVLGAIAMWMTMNGRRYVSRADALACVENCLHRFPVRRGEEPYTPDEVLDHLVDRSGLLHETEVDVLEFRHASFQDYLAAGEMIQANHIDHLLRNARDPLYHDVLIMAVSHTQDEPERQRRILDGLIELASNTQSDAERRTYWLLAGASTSDVGMVDPDVAQRIEQATRALLPPTNAEQAEMVAAAGEFVLDLLSQAASGGELTADEAVWTIHAAVMVAADDAIPLVRRFRHRPELSVRAALVASWNRVPDTERYLREVLAEVDFEGLIVTVPSPEFLTDHDELLTATAFNLPGHAGPFPVESLTRFPRLTFLYFDRMADLNLEPLAELPDLTELAFVAATARDLTALRAVRGLRKLYFVGSINDVTPLATLSGLRVLHLIDTPVATLAPLAALTNLEELCTFNSHVKDFDSLAGLPNLKINETEPFNWLP
ncbi:NACHT domain-containing protein [Yinghuangia seranimata]|uniref:NACHT domain-containing protein n=1 Tax=Yinghuangia seranimata TaxID=408067 RepID=UPI00248D318C|nr:NACHT domain-containing protein [Yinghuangia seranimata]MDI2131141.1 NACHT domain-containing protein [Yinghuangia seranimata]